MKRSTICLLSNYGPEYAGSFVDAILSLSLYCRDRLKIAPFCIFSERARGRKWLVRFNDEKILTGFVPESRAVIYHVRSLLYNYDPLIFHTHFDCYDLSAVFLKLFFYKKARIIWHFHGISPLTLHQQVKDLLKVKILANYFGDKFISVGNQVYEYALSRGFPRDKLVLSYNGIDTKRFSTIDKKQDSLRESLAIPKDKYVFLLLGWDPVRKGVDIFIRAAEELARKNNQKALYLIVGRENTRKFVSGLPQTSRLASALRIIEPVDDFGLLLNSVDALVSASRSEGFSYAMLEAMAAGRLILSSELADIHEMLGQSKGVWLFPDEDWEMLSVLMERAQSLSPDEREALSSANSQYVADHFSLESWTEQIGGIYSDLLQEK
jgi:glycosyltransferase involved in cell wall biosynthesis